MFDTVVFNRILDGVLTIDELTEKGQFYATHIQLDEINNTPNIERRQALLEVFNEITVRNIPTESFVLDTSRLGEAKLGGGNIIPTETGVWDVSTWDQAKWGEENGLYTSFKTELDLLNKGKKNNIQDTLIVETAIKNRFILITDYIDLCTVTKLFGGKCATTEQFKSNLERKIAT